MISPEEAKAAAEKVVREHESDLLSNPFCVVCVTAWPCEALTQARNVLALHTLLLEFVASLTLCDHMGDVGNDIVEVLGRLGVEYEDDGSGENWGDLPKLLHGMGIKTLVGTDVWHEGE